MARSTKTRTEKAADAMKTADEATIVDAEVVSETPALMSEPPSLEPVDKGAGAGSADQAPGDTAPELSRDDGETITGTVEEVASANPPEEPDPLSRPWQETETERQPEPEPAPVRMAEPPPAPAPVTVQRVGFVPLVLGGVVAAGLGFAAGWQGFLPSSGADATAAALADQGARVDALAAEVAALPPAPDLAPLTGEIAALRAEIAPLADRIAALESRMEALERAPANDGTLSATAIAAWQQDIETLKAAVAAQEAQTQAISDAAAARDAELAGLQDAMAAQEAEMARMVEEAAQRLNAAESTVAGIEQEATAAATATLRRAVLASLQTAVDSGQPYANLLGELAGSGVEAPEGLAARAADGVPTEASLVEAFPDAARAALSAARAEGLADDGGGGVMGFLRSQLDVRSVEPREGDDPDAILSRAEAALREARLGDALAEIAALPEVVRAAMGDWVAAAEARVAALSALQALAESLPTPETSN